MSEERPSSERNGERDSQLSAMFDGELSAAECELLARRLTRDEVLRAQWSRYSMIGAALRAERGVALHDRVAWRVQSAITQETTYGDDSATSTRITAVVPGEVLRRAASRRWTRLGRPMFGAGIAASVAAASILFLRGQGGMEQPELLAAAEAPTSIVLAPEGPGNATPAAAATSPAASTPTVASNGEPERYSTPVPSSSTGIVPPARLANYVVAHSEYSGPLSRRLALLGLVGNESAGEAPTTADPADLADATGAPDAQ